MKKQKHPLPRRDKQHIDHCLEQGLTTEEVRYIATTFNDALQEPDADVNGLRQPVESLTPQGLHAFNTLIDNSDKEYASWAEPLKDNP
jgi:hypothetical protein